MLAGLRYAGSLFGTFRRAQEPLNAPFLSSGIFLTGGNLNPGERHSRVTPDEGTVTLCALRAATVL